MKNWPALMTALLLVANCGAPAIAEDATVTIAVAQDGDGPESAIVKRIESELPEHLGSGDTVRFKHDAAFDAGWQPERIPDVLQAALEDPDVDLVLVVGSLLTAHAALPEVTLSKPVVSTFVQRADIFRLPYDEAGSQKENLSFTAIPQRAGRDVRAFLEIVDFRTLHVLAGAEELDDSGRLHEGLRAYERELGIDIELVPVTPDVPELLSHLSAGVEATYITRLPRLSIEQRGMLIDGLNALEIPTFSLLGHPDVERGVLAGITPDIREQLARRVAINIARLIDGDTVERLPVLLSVDTRLLVNGETAAAVGYRPGAETRLFADFLHREALTEQLREIAFAEALSMAEAGNAELPVRDSEVESVRQDRYRVRSTLYPQLSVDLDYLKTDATLLNPIFPQGSADATTGTVRLRQLIYDDEAWSLYKASGERFRGSQFEREAARLDILSDAGSAYLQLGLAHSLQRIEADNLRLSEDNLELARLRRDVGYSGREEILRWEAAVAEGRGALFLSEEDVEVARIAFNQILGVDQHLRWTLEQFDIDPDVFSLLDGRLDAVFDDYAAVRRLRDVLVGIALENDPELLAIDRAIAAQAIRLAEFRRRYFVPLVFVDAVYSERFNRSGNTFLIPDDNSYSVLVGASYPIYQGGRRKHDVARASSDLQGLQRQRLLTEQLVERRTRTALRRCENSFPRIKFSRQSATAAREGLALVTDRYAEGIDNVTDLLDAQNQSFGSEQLATAVTFQFSLDLVELQRALSWFEQDNSAEEQDRFVEQILTSVAERPEDPEDATR